SRHTSGGYPGNALDFFINTSGSAGGSSAPGTGNLNAFTIDASATVAYNQFQTQAIYQCNAGLNMNSGNISFPNNGASIRFGADYSKIYDNGDLHIYTDDNMHIDLGTMADALFLNSNGFTVNAPLVTLKNGTANRIVMNGGTQQFTIGSAPGDSAGDWHLYNAKDTYPVLGFFRTGNILKLGSGSTTISIGNLSIKPSSQQTTFAGGGCLLLTNYASPGDGFRNGYFERFWDNQSSKGFLKSSTDLSLTSISSPGDFRITANGGNNAVKTYGTFQAYNYVSGLFFESASHAGVGTSNRWSTDFSFPLRVLNNSSMSTLNMDYTTMSNTNGGAFQCQGTARFDSVVVLTGVNTTNRSGSYYYMYSGGTGSSTSSGNYSLVVNGRLMVTGGEINVYSDERLKQDVCTIQPSEALEAVKHTRSVKYRYENEPEQERLGFIAQDMLKHPIFHNLISRACYGEEERYVLNEQGITSILWAAVRELASKEEKLESKDK
ncbi:hypothetical protein HDV00_011710, partial [Rhizophlyctis rosea]